MDHRQENNRRLLLDSWRWQRNSGTAESPQNTDVASCSSTDIAGPSKLQRHTSPRTDVFSPDQLLAPQDYHNTCERALAPHSTQNTDEAGSGYVDTGEPRDTAPSAMSYQVQLRVTAINSPGTDNPHLTRDTSEAACVGMTGRGISKTQTHTVSSDRTRDPDDTRARYDQQHRAENCVVSTRSKIQTGRYESDQPVFNFSRGIGCMAYSCLEELYTTVIDETKLVDTLISGTVGFREHLNSSNMAPHLIRLTLAVITKACMSPVRQPVIELLNNVVQSPFLELHVAVTYLMKIMHETNATRQVEYCKPIGDIVDLIQAILTCLPSFYNKCQSLLIILERLPLITNLKDAQISHIKNRMKELQSQAQEIQQTRAGQNRKNSSRNIRSQKAIANPFENLPPPNNFREISICPIYQDIHSEEKPYLRSNKDKGGYDNLDHYLDVQFRLLREEYVSPLREGILEYLGNIQRGKPDTKLQDMRLYRDVQIICPRCTPDGISYRIQFNTKRLGKIRWQASKRLMYGSLLCLSSNNFQSMVFAIVIGREAKDLVDGFLDVRFVDKTFVPDEDDDQTRYLMAETTAYVEAYRHVLSGLQKIDDLPFQRYIVACEHEVNPPRYLLRQAPPAYDLSCLVKADANKEEKMQAKYVPVLTTSRWPSKHTFCFDDSQLHAVKTALTKEFAIIQGPPGTGKTFVGLKIVQTLLENKAHWSSVGPILVVCYTNHALDQFLEGMLDYLDNGLVRVGGRCENENLQKFVVRNIKARMKKDRNVRREVRDGTSDCWREMMTIKEEIEDTAARLETCACGILHEKMLQHCMTDEQFDSFHAISEGDFSGVRNMSTMAAWLSLDASMYEDIEDRFGESNLFSLKPEHMDAVLLKCKNDLIAVNMKTIQLLREERRRLEKELQELQNGCLDAALFLGTNQSLWGIPLQTRWAMYSVWVHRLCSQKTFQLRTIAREMDILQSRYQALPQQPRGNAKRKKKKNVNEETLQLDRRAAELDESRQTMQRDQERMGNGILLTSILMDVMTPTEKQYFQNTNTDQNQEYLAASWLGYGEVVNVIAAHTDRETEEKEDELEEDIFIDAKEEVEAISTHRCIDDNDEFGDSFAKAKLQDRKRIEAMASDQLTVSLGREQRPARATENGWQLQKPNKSKLRQRIKQILLGTGEMPEDLAKCVSDIWTLDLKDRHQLYRHWLSIYRRRLKDCIRKSNQRYDEIAARLTEVRDDEDYDVMKAATVIGMTTTGAARFRHVLNRVQPRIIVVEEAAEVLEAHIISALNASCEHLILIGDHKQLRPSPAVYKLAKNFNLELSLFERMVTNNVQCDTLQLQHRMRPEIADLMQYIYPELQNHESVLGFEDVKGVRSNIFFLDHTSQEVKHEENKSRSNVHEARFVSALCQYLILQGYEATQITVLTTYTGQVFLLKNQMTKSFFEGVRVTAVDNYQGEENDIILLSLVRSNTEGSIGFLNVENRVCVALSRARKGLFVIGNFNLLASHSQLWTNIVTMLKSKQQLGPKLGLYCQKHPAIARIEASSEKDFEAAPEGGCLRPCEARLECGHQCEKPCHILDSGHENYECQKPCRRKCPSGHECSQLCYLPCLPCSIKIQKVIPSCRHVQMVSCHLDEYLFSCQDECAHVLSCGHRCTARCGDQHSNVCEIMVCKTLPCGHTFSIPCYVQPENYPCPTTCGVVLNCQHICTGTCESCRKGTLHSPCREPCGRILLCGHSCLRECNESCQPCRRICENRCVHRVCGKTCREPCVLCEEPCEWRCEHFTCTNLCGDICDRPPCNEPCGQTLPCGHPCLGLCAEDCPSFCRVCDKDMTFSGNEAARYILLQDCGDIVEVEVMDKWMLISDESETNNVQLKTCPKCKTPIRNSLRYGNTVKVILRNIVSLVETLEAARSQTNNKLLQTTILGSLSKTLYHHLRDKLKKITTIAEFGILEKQISILNRICEIQLEIDTEANSEHLDADTQVNLQKELQMVEDLVLTNVSFTKDVWKSCGFLG